MNRKTAFREFPEIRTKRLVLRQPTMKDAGWYFDEFGNFADDILFSILKSDRHEK